MSTVIRRGAIKMSEKLPVYNKTRKDKIMYQYLQELREGYSMSEAARRIGLAPQTLVNWRKHDVMFQRAVDYAYWETGRGIVEDNLYRLAQGAETEEITVESVDEDEQGRPVRTKRTVKKQPPSVKALSLLASKFCKGEFTEGDDGTITIKITQKDRSLTMDERKAILNKDKEESSDIEAIDYKDLED
jgi:transcriptional regulator with XRE-family HTH domain